MPIRGARSFMPPKREKAKKMFSGTDTSGEHKDLQSYALKPHNNKGGMSNSVGGGGKKQATSYRGGEKNGGK